MIRTCYRCPAFVWLYNRDIPNCKLDFNPQSYARPDNCKKKPKSTKEMLRLKQMAKEVITANKKD